jgi:hypothetical protein
MLRTSFHVGIRDVTLLAFNVAFSSSNPYLKTDTDFARRFIKAEPFQHRQSSATQS